nr:hypothetical protein BdHM001_34800 [Bdellovibrio sp. HM001]
MDNEIGNTEGMKLSEVAEKIFRGNLAMINDCDIVIANITPFRGPSVDPGTAYEIGAAFALGKPIFYYVSDDEEYNHDFSIRSKEYRDSAFPVIEEFGQIDNLMISRSSLLPNHAFRDLESCLSHVRHSLQKRKAG